MITHPALLYAGEYVVLQDTVHKYLTALFCPTKQEHCQCTICRQLTDHEHPNVTRVTPSKEYVLKDLDPIFQRIQYQLEPNERYCFVIEHAEKLTVNCANKLLKVLEEPPQGYQFIVMSNNYHALIATIRSRCHVMYQQTEQGIITHPLTHFFSSKEHLHKPIAFEKALREEAPSTHDALQIAQQLLLTSEQLGYPMTETVYDILIYAAKNPPLPGGTTLYLKRLYIQLAATVE